MKNKKVIIVVGLIALAGVGFYLWNKSKTGANSDSSENKVDGTRSSDASDSESNNVTDESTEGGSSGTNIKDLKGKDKREFRKETRDICKEKYVRGKDYRQCKSRVKGGGVAFTGDFDDFRNDYIDFKGQISNQFMFSNFDSDLNLDL